jgi:hypothetical protein
MSLRKLLGMVLAVVCTQGCWVGAARAQSGATNTSAKASKPAAAAPPLRVEVEPRVELLSLIFRLAGNPEYNRPRVKAYADEAQAQFGGLRDHAVVQLAQELRSTSGVSYDAVMAMAVHLSDAEQLQLRIPLEPWPESLDHRWNAESASKFVVAARQFVKDSKFGEFVQQHQPLYAKTAARLQALLDQKSHLEWFNAFFGERPKATFTVVPGLLNGGNCYGPHFKDPNGQEELYCILGVWQTDAEGQPEFTEAMLDTVVHEFCHSYANPLIGRHETEFQQAGDTLFRAVAQKMRSQAYGQASTMMRESLVRACTCRYVLEFQGVSAAKRAMQQEKSRGFLWMEELCGVLGEYESDRSTYPTLEQFAPRLVAFFKQYARDFSSRPLQPKGTPPRVAKLIPANGATNVDPELTEIRVQFDRPMKDGCWSMCGDGPNFPEIVGRPRYEAGCTNWVVSVKLKPNWDYEFSLNAASYDAFRSADNVPLEPMPVTFRTGAAKKSP